jgi:hypothetical protein
MKYGLLSVPWGHNIGDAVQSMLLHDLYKEHGIESVEYVPVGMSSKYKGEKMVIPLNACHVYGGPQDARKFAQSEDIDYRYLGFHLHGDLSSFGKYVQIKSDYPIGCRDVPTRDFLRKLGYNAYFSGCISMTLPKRPDGDYKLVYVIDDDAKKGLPFCDPVDLRPITSLCLPDGEPWEKSEERARERINLLRDTAKLVITSRLHVYLPCVAMGIPVVFTRPIIPRTSLVEIFTPATVDYFKPLVAQHFRNALFDEGECVAEELDNMAVLADRPFDK